MTQFSGQVAIITGASGLLGSGLIPVFRTGGAKLALTCGRHSKHFQSVTIIPSSGFFLMAGASASSAG